MATRIINIDGKKIRHERITKKNGKVYDYFYEVTEGGKKKGQKFSFKSIYGSSLQVKKEKESKLNIEQKEAKIFEEFGKDPKSIKRFKDIKESLKRQGKTLEDVSYSSLASRMIGFEDLDEQTHVSDLNKAKKLIRNLGYTEEEFQNIYGINADQLSHAKTSNGEITIGNKVYEIRWNYTGYEDLVLLRTIQ